MGKTEKILLKKNIVENLDYLTLPELRTLDEFLNYKLFKKIKEKPSDLNDDEIIELLKNSEIESLDTLYNEIITKIKSNNGFYSKNEVRYFISENYKTKSSDSNKLVLALIKTNKFRVSKNNDLY